MSVVASKLPASLSKVGNATLFSIVVVAVVVDVEFWLSSVVETTIEVDVEVVLVDVEFDVKVVEGSVVEETVVEVWLSSVVETTIELVVVVGSLTLVLQDVRVARMVKAVIKMIKLNRRLPPPVKVFVDFIEYINNSLILIKLTLRITYL